MAAQPTLEALQERVVAELAAQEEGWTVAARAPPREAGQEEHPETLGSLPRAIPLRSRIQLT